MNLTLPHKFLQTFSKDPITTAKINNSEFLPYDKFNSKKSYPDLRIKDFNLSIQGHKILKNINTTIPNQSITCIIGPSGCGKTTLLKSINRLNENLPNVKIQGDILLDNENIYGKNVELTHLRKKLGLLSQRPTPLPMSIYENITYGCKIHGLKNKKKLNVVVEYYLKAVGLWEEIKDRLHTPATRLSIGQQQRLCLARGLAVEPEFILGDESTSALDPISSGTIEQLFLSLKEEYGIILVTHTLRQAKRIADYVIFMYMGEIIEQGKALEIFENPQQELTQKYISGAFS
ncbi:phosphate ABC transporter ATP-binding protein [Apibacter muscae]|uniref:Phosphate ABC transporter ATP-binding protein n=1 Tax=Apibacter muscae TaxID=2509004 RepID=A0A563DFH1_9FLAO|nr:phosphate ABC transporter ATP-binding protein [Apibacter muscae]TWP28975.1 phosphate ABC transporter ATP-binding protein [Apibacter muscae]